MRFIIFVIVLILLKKHHYKANTEGFDTNYSGMDIIVGFIMFIMAVGAVMTGISLVR